MRLPSRALDMRLFFSKKAYHSLQAHLASTSYSSIFFLVDNNTKKHCLALFLEHFPDLEDAPVLCMDAGRGAQAPWQL